MNFSLLVAHFCSTYVSLVSEAQLNYGDPNQSEEETIEALGEFNIVGTCDESRIMLSKDKYMGSPTPIGVKVFCAPHKQGVPANSYGIFREKQRLKEEYQGMSKSEIGAVLRTKRVSITESYDEGILCYTGDTTIQLLRQRWKEICPISIDTLFMRSHSWAFPALL